MINSLSQIEPNLSLCEHYKQLTPIVQDQAWFRKSVACALPSMQNHIRNNNNLHIHHQQDQAEMQAIPGNMSQDLPISRIAQALIGGFIQQLETQVDWLFHGYWARAGDERTSKLPLMSAGPWRIIVATSIYLYLIKILLPRIMAHRTHPFELNWLIRAYNLCMVMANVFAFYHGARILNWGSRSFGCNKLDSRDKSAETMELLHYGWLFMLSRLVEWLDTVFFCLRKRHRQVTKLHVFHHSFVPILCWFYLKFYPDVSMAFFPFVNTFVHTIMYTYYLLATFGPKLAPYLWWKKYLTSLQIAQFVAILIQLISIPLSGNPACQAPGASLCIAIAGASLFLWLFYTYYMDTYSKSKDYGHQIGRSCALSELVDDAIAPVTDRKDE